MQRTICDFNFSVSMIVTITPILTFSYLYAADSVNDCIFRVDLTTAAVMQIAGSKTTSGSTNGIGGLRLMQIKH